MKAVIALTLLLAVASVSAQRKKEGKPLALIGGADSFVEIPLTVDSPRADLENGRRLMSSQPRRLLGIDTSGGAEITSRLVAVQKQCPATVADYATIYVNSTTEGGTTGGVLGELINDYGICDTGVAGKGTVTLLAGETTLGGSAQDFVNKPSWETYGWSLFYIPVPSEDDTTATNITRIQGINLQVIGNIGRGSAGGSTCSLDAISVGIFEAGTDGTYAVGTMKWQRKVLLTGPRNGATFSWTSNSTSYVYTDIVDVDTPEDAIELAPGAYYWLRVKMFVDYTPTKRCFAFWGMSSTPHNAAGIKSRWQERGGSAGYSTNCVGASSSPTATPGQYQSFWNCWNNGVSVNLANPLYRRCSTYRLQVSPSLASGDCLDGGADFNDYNYALVGLNGETGAMAGR